MPSRAKRAQYLASKNRGRSVQPSMPQKHGNCPCARVRGTKPLARQTSLAMISSVPLLKGSPLYPAPRRLATSRFLDPAVENPNGSAAISESFPSSREQLLEGR